MGDWIRASLGRKFAFALTAGLLSASLVFLVLFVGLYTRQLEQERAQVSEQVNRLLQAALENAMLKRDLQGLTDIVDRLGAQPGVRNVMIVNPAGEVRFSSNPDRLGHIYDAKGDAECANCHAGTGPAAGRTIFLAAEDGDILRSVNPVRNKEPCQQCHGPMAEHPVNGILFVDYDAEQLRGHARATALALIGSGALVVLAMVTGVWALLDRQILRRLAAMGSASRAIAAGRLDVEVAVEGRDELSQVGAAFNDMVANLRARLRDIRDKEAFLQALIDAVPDGIRVIGEDWRIVKVNRAYRRQQGAEDGPVVGETCHASSHRRDAPCPANLVTCPLEVTRREQAPIKTVHTHTRADGRTLEVEVYAAPMVIEQEGMEKFYVVEAIRDLAEDVRFSHEQKLSAVGQLAAGVAHEIRNPLASVRLALQGLLRDLDSRGGERQVIDYLRLMDDQIDKCIDVSNRLLRLSAGSDGRRGLVDVNPGIVETLSLMAWHAEELGITVETDLDPTSPRIVAADGDIRMLVLNLVQNAFHAMPAGGRLVVATRQDEDTVWVVVEDTGVGIPADHRRRIFEPFFSHRADGQPGTGLGLAICKSIAEGLGGGITVDSVVGRGSRFTVTLPSAQSAIACGGHAEQPA